jgi:hypothetical protein
MKYQPTGCNLGGNFRLNYCGTCKAIGSIYSQKSRMLLNSDIVFLSEILSSIELKDDYQQLDEKFHSFNCFKIPDSQNIPKSLQFTSALNVVLGTFKLKDNINDTGVVMSNFWKSLDWLQAEDYQKAKTVLKDFGFEVEIIESLLSEQFKREKQTNQDLEYYLTPSASISGLAFEQGFEAIAQTKYGFEFGYEFGKLVNLIDAVKDFHSDIKKSKFNPLYSAFNVSNKELSNFQKSQLKNFLDKTIKKITILMEDMPISSERKAYFLEKLNVNLSSLDELLQFKKETFKDKAIAYKENALYLTQKASYMILLAISIFLPFLAPNKLFAQNVLKAESSNDCVGCLGLCFCGALCYSMVMNKTTVRGPYGNTYERETCCCNN